MNTNPLLVTHDGLARFFDLLWAVNGSDGAKKTKRAP